MTWARIQGAGAQNSTASASVAVSLSGVVAGHLVICCVNRLGTTTQSSFSDSQSNTWTLLVDEAQSTQNSLSVYYSVITTGGSLTITSTASASPAYQSITADEYSFTAGTISASHAVNTGYTQTAFSTGSATFSSNVLVIGAVGYLFNSASNFSWNAGFTQRESQPYSNGVALGLTMADVQNTTTSPQTPAGTFTGGTATYAGVTGVFQSSGDISLTAGSASTTSVGNEVASVSVGTAVGGDPPYFYQWYRSLTSGFSPGPSSIISGATEQTFHDTGLVNGTTYFYINVVTDSASSQATSNQTAATPTFAPASLTVGHLPSRDITPGMGFVFGVDGGARSGICEILPNTLTANAFAPGVLEPQSTAVVYASTTGAPICNPNNPQEAADATAALQAVLDLAQSQPLTLIIDACFQVQNLNIYSGTTIQGLGKFDNYNGLNEIPAGLFMGTITNGTNSCILKNAHWASPYNGGTISDQDITIKDLYLDGQRRNNVSGSQYVYANTNGQFISPIQIFGCYNVNVENVFIYDPCCYHQHYANIYYSSFRNITSCDPIQYAGNNPLTSRYTDGFHLNGPADRIWIEGFTVTSSDDGLAFNAADGNLSETIGPLSGPQAFGGFETVYLGNITNVVASDIRCLNTNDVGHCLIGADPRNTSNTASCENIIIANVVGNVWQTGFMNSGYPDFCAQGGQISQVLLKNWALTPFAGPSGINVQGFGIGGGVVEDLHIDGFIWNNVFAPTSAPFQANQINVITGSTITNLTIENYQIAENSSEVSNPGPAVTVPTGSTIDELNFINCRWNRNANTAQAFLSITGSTTNRVNMSDCSFNNINNAITIGTGSTVGGVNLTGLSHRNAGGNASLVLSSGVTLGRLRAAGLDTALLTSGGTITSEKTDGTQDA